MARVPALLCTVLVCAQCALAQGRQDRFFDSDGVRIRYQVSGRGRPVVLIHGFGETLERWHSAGVAQVLLPHFRVVAMDIRAHGRSGKPHNREAYGAELAADVVRLLRHLGEPKAHIVGYSMGALVALDVAVLHQEYARSVVLGGAGWNPPEARDEFKQQAEAFESGKFQVRDGGDPRALAAALRGVRVLSEQDVRSIKVPVAALVGADDRFLSNVQRLSRVLPSVHVSVIPGANHATAIEHSTFAQALLTFLGKQDSVAR